MDAKHIARRVLGLRAYGVLTRGFHASRGLIFPHQVAEAADPVESGELIRSIILGRQPAAIGKVGASELRAIRQFLAVNDGRRAKPKRSVITELHVVSGVFPPTDGMLMRFAQHFVEVAARMDLLVAWRRPGEQQLFERYCPTAKLISMEGLDPFYLDQPWTSALAGKTVLVASPFTDSIARQYIRKSLVWPDRQQLFPDLDLQLMRLPFSDGLVKSAHGDWFEALETLLADLNSRDFDVLLVGGGAFSLPLAIAAKAMGKVGIHLGGSTQVLFGIRGARWDSHPVVSQLYNQHWVRPSPEETPPNHKNVEAGSYW